MKNYPIDVQIYVSNLMNVIEEILPQLCIDEEIEDVDQFKTILEENILISATENMIDFDEPMFDEEQINKLIMSSIVKYHLDNMLEKGLLKAEVDIETGENVYSLAD
jgi:hypothetical protein